MNSVSYWQLAFRHPAGWLGPVLTLALFLLSFNLPQVAGAAFERRRANSREEAYSWVHREVGPSVSRDLAPGTYRILENLFARLSEAQEGLYASDFLVLNEFAIVNSPKSNMFVMTLSDRGVSKHQNCVFITTGLLRELMANDRGELTEEEIVPGFLRVTGTIAHELAHPLDRRDIDGLSASPNSQMVSQAKEIRADLEAQILLRAAQLPEDSLYQALLRVFTLDEARKNPRQNPSMIRDLLGTHPAYQLRLGVQRGALTLRRYELGTPSVRLPEIQKADELLSEFVEMRNRESSGKISFPERPHNLREAIHMLENLIADPRLEREKNYFNRLVSDLDQFLLEAGTDIPEETLSALLSLNEKIIERPKGLPFFHSDYEFKSWEREDRDLGLKLSYPHHRVLVEKIPFYRSDAYRAWLYKIFETYLKSEKLSRFKIEESRILRLFDLAPAEVIFDVLGEDIYKDLIEPSFNDIPREPVMVLDQELGKDHAAGELAPARIEFHKFYYERAWAALPESTRQHFTRFNPSYRVRDEFKYTPLLLKFEIGYGIHLSDAEIEKQLQASRSILESKEKWQKFSHKIAREVWGNRAELALMELHTNSYTDWHYVFQKLGLESEDAWKELKSSIVEYLQSDKYPALLQFLGRKGAAVNSGKLPPWFDESFLPDLAGEGNSDIRHDETLGNLARSYFARPALLRNPNLFRKHYADSLARLLNNATQNSAFTAEDLLRFHENVVAELLGKLGTEESFPFVDLIPRTVMRSSLPEDKKSELLNAIFFQTREKARGVFSELSGKTKDWWIPEQFLSQHRQTFRLLIQVGAAQSPSNALAQLFGQSEANADDSLWKRHFLRVEELHFDLSNELREMSLRPQADELLSFSRNVLDPLGGKYHGNSRIHLNRRVQQELKKSVMQIALQIPQNPATDREIFLSLSGTGPTDSGDAFFDQRLRDDLVRERDVASKQFIQRILKEGRIRSVALQMKLARHLLDEKILFLSNGHNSRDLSELVEELNLYVGGSSQLKDDYLEEISWKLRVHKEAELSYLESEKALNWRKANPILINFLSTTEAAMRDMSADVRMELVRALANPRTLEAPLSFQRHVHQVVRRMSKSALASKFGDGSSRDETLQFESLRSELSEQIIKSLEFFLLNSGALERIPVVDLLLNVGADPIIESSSLLDRTLVEILELKPGTSGRIAFEAFMNSIPPHERSISLAYRICSAQESGDGLKESFEVFRSPGKKGGQLAYFLRLFGEEQSERLGDLKDNARPMTKAQVVKILKSRPDDFQKIESIDRILGSASLKTVVLITLKDGRKGAAVLLNPHAREQLTSIMLFAKSYVEELKKSGLSAQLNLADQLIRALDEQLLMEVSMLIDVQKTKIAAPLYEKLNQEMSTDLNGWKFRVPRLLEDFTVSDDGYFMEFADGKSLDEIESPELREKLGEHIVDSSLRLLFRHGLARPDPHDKNFIFNEADKTIFPIDFGQDEIFSRNLSFGPSEVHDIAEFFRALNEKDAWKVLRHSKGFMKASSHQPEITNEVVLAVNQILQQNDNVSERLIQVSESLASRGFQFHYRFLLGIFKEFLILTREKNYPGSTVFQSLMRREIRRTLMRDPIRSLKNQCQDYFKKSTN